MWYKTFLPKLHEIIRPAGYVEIGIRHGYSLSLSPIANKIAIDPVYGTTEMQFDIKNCRFFKMTSDDFFREHDLDEMLPQGFDLAYIDGLHLFEFALRDLINLEKHAKKGSIIIIDDVIPRTEAEANRKATGGPWAGDVWKLVDCLSLYRPRLFESSLLARSEPTGCLVLTAPDRQDDALIKHYDEILKTYLDPLYPVMPGRLFSQHAMPASEALAAIAESKGRSLTQ